MAAIKCPDCGRTISDKSSRCPNCGCPTSVAVKHHKRNMIVTLLVIAILLLIGIFSEKDKSNSNKGGKTTSKTEKVIESSAKSAETNESDKKVDYSRKSETKEHSETTEEWEQSSESTNEEIQAADDGTANEAKGNYDAQFEQLKKEVIESVN